MRFTSRALRAVLVAVFLPGLAALTIAAPANADHGRDNPCWDKGVNCKFKESSNLKPTPPDPYGKNAKARITGFRGGKKYAVDFQAYDEVVYLRDGNPDNHAAVVKIRYLGPGGPYKYKYTTGGKRTIQLGSDGDLTESKRIKLKLCIAHHGCTGWAKGWT
ncbi:MAG: hypothetical protein ACRDO7_00090 [Nocardioidaceae bacterium]